MTTTDDAIRDALRRPPLDPDDEQGLAQDLTLRWLARAQWAVERAQDGLAPDARHARVLLSSWMALARINAPATSLEPMSQVRDALEGLILPSAEALVRLALQDLALEAWASAFEAYCDQVGDPTSWDMDTSTRARELIEALDEALLIEAAALTLGLILPLDIQDALNHALDLATERAYALMPAQVFICACAATFELDGSPGESAAPSTYPLWLALMDAREVWALREVFSRAALAHVLELSTDSTSGRASQDEASLAQLLDLDALRALRERGVSQASLAQPVPLDERLPLEPYEQLLAAASPQRPKVPKALRWRADAWSARVALPDLPKHLGPEVKVSCAFTNLPARAVGALIGGRYYPLEISAQGNARIELRLGELRSPAASAGLILLGQGDGQDLVLLSIGRPQE